MVLCGAGWSCGGVIGERKRCVPLYVTRSGSTPTSSIFAKVLIALCPSTASMATLIMMLNVTTSGWTPSYFIMSITHATRSRS